ncbi:hypothetical protein O3P69_005126 [Scylla paramamosain]|uniref:Major facilitator superfamily (MFS) profile domain-containing protein n=1 Tax=Scylla paramamosain TaxID=85552 RepID=A0AAW0UAW6_SCYPA
MCSFCGYLRYLLVFLGLLGCGMDYMLRYNISVAIVAMVNNSATFSVNSSYACPAASNASSDAQSSTGAGEYNWTPKEQGLVLGTFFWGYVITKAIGGRIAEILGPTFTVSLTLGLCSILSFLTPTIADVHPLALAFLRLLMGLLQGPIFPAIYSIISRWTLPGETTTMISASMSGASLGALVALGLSGIVIKSFGWRWVFWGSGIVTLAWLPFWVLYTELHRLSKNHNQLRKKVPWSRIFKSKYVYLFMMMEFVNVWTQTIMISEGPTFLTNQVGIRLDDASKLNTILTVLAQFLIIFYGWLSDFLERREWLSMLTVRRLFQMFGTLVMVGCLMGLAFAGCDAFEVAVYFIVLIIGLPITIVTYIIGPMIIAPNYAGTLTGMMGLGTIGGFLLPLFVSLFMDKKNGWMTVFLVSAAINLVTGVIYVIWMPNEEEEWNMYEEIPESDKDGMKKNGKMKGGTLTQ